MALREGIVVGDVRAAVGLGDAQIGEQKGYGLGGHGGTPVGVEGELAGDDLVLGTGFGDELAGQFLALPMRPHPADDIPAEDVEDYIEVEVGPLGGAQPLGDVPTPELIDRQSTRLNSSHLVVSYAV